MTAHVRYEVMKLLEFVHVRNYWPYQVGFAEDLAQFTSESLLEAGMIHCRNMVEFLQFPVSGAIDATHYVPDWVMPEEFTIDGKDYAELSTRLVHIGFKRLTVQTHGDFDWSQYFAEIVPRVLGGFRRFLVQLSPHHTEVFAQPSPDHPRIDLYAAIEFQLGPE